MTLSDAARKLGYTKPAVSNWIERGWLDADVAGEWRGKRYTVTEENLRAFVCGNNGATINNDKIVDRELKQLHADAHGIPDGYEHATVLAKRFYTSLDGLTYYEKVGRAKTVRVGGRVYFCAKDLEAIYESE